MKNVNGCAMICPKNDRCITKISFYGEYDEANIGLLYRGGPIFSDKPQDTDLTDKNWHLTHENEFEQQKWNLASTNIQK